MVGRVNLAAAWVTMDRRDQALAFLNENINQARSLSYQRLLANCFELRAQLHFHAGDYAAARADLTDAATAMGPNPSLDQFFIQKWSAVIEAFEQRDVTPLKRMREEAIQRSHWETVREADRFALKIEFSRPLFHHLMFGTPFAEYRAMVQKDYEIKLSGGTHLHGTPGGEVLELATGRFGDGKQGPPPKVLAVLKALTRDFYRPIGVGGLFAEIFPEDYLDINSSIHRVHQLVHRARAWISENKLPFEIVADDAGYSCRFTGPFAFLVPFERQTAQVEAMRLAHLESLFGAREFSAKEASRALEISLSSFKPVALWGIERGRLLRLGSGSATRYRIPSAANAAA
jgi:hypothetical protein